MATSGTGSASVENPTGILFMINKLNFIFTIIEADWIIYYRILM